jgi:hypothetical protein
MKPLYMKIIKNISTLVSLLHWISENVQWTTVNDLYTHLYIHTIKYKQYIIFLNFHWKQDVKNYASFMVWGFSYLVPVWYTQNYIVNYLSVYTKTVTVKKKRRIYLYFRKCFTVIFLISWNTKNILLCHVFFTLYFFSFNWTSMSKCKFFSFYLM